jgi:hypothetical protein
MTLALPYTRLHPHRLTCPILPERFLLTSPLQRRRAVGRNLRIDHPNLRTDVADRIAEVSPGFNAILAGGTVRSTCPGGRRSWTRY